MKQEVKTKRCSRCGRVLPINEFTKNKATRDRLGVYCKSCRSDYLRQLRAVKRRELGIKRTIKR